MFSRIVLIAACLCICLPAVALAGRGAGADAPEAAAMTAPALPLCASLRIGLSRVQGAADDDSGWGGSRCARRAWPSAPGRQAATPLRPLPALWLQLPRHWRGPIARAWSRLPPGNGWLQRVGLELDLGTIQLRLGALVPAQA